MNKVMKAERFSLCLFQKQSEIDDLEHAEKINEALFDISNARNAISNLH